MTEEHGVDGREGGEAHRGGVAELERHDPHVPLRAGLREDGVRDEIDAIDVDDGRGRADVGDGERGVEVDLGSHF